MAIIFMEDDFNQEAAHLIGLYELQAELIRYIPNKLLDIHDDYLRKFRKIHTYLIDEKTIQLIRKLETPWKLIAQEAFEILIHTLKQFNIEIRKQNKVTYGEQYRKLDKLVSEKIRPALMAHAGNVSIAYITPHIVGLKLMGACHGCPMSIQTLTVHIAKILGIYFPEFLIIHVTRIIDYDPERDDDKELS